MFSYTSPEQLFPCVTGVEFVAGGTLYAVHKVGATAVQKSILDNGLLVHCAEPREHFAQLALSQGSAGNEARRNAGVAEDISVAVPPPPRT